MAIRMLSKWLRYIALEDTVSMPWTKRDPSTTQSTTARESIVNKSVRLHHPTLFSCNYVVELPAQPMAPRTMVRACQLCSKPGAPFEHATKAIHLRLNGNGDVFVHPDILKLLRTVPAMAGLEVHNEILNAPPLEVGAVESDKAETVTAQQRFWLPGRTKYESADIMQKPFLPLAEAIAETKDRAATAKKAEKKKTFIFGKRTG